MNNPFNEMSNKLNTNIGFSTKGKWADAPDWARWIAQSADGTWEWFSTKPQPHNFGLYVVGTFMPSGKGKKETIMSGDGKYYFSKQNPNWRGTVEKRPKEKEKLV